MLFLLFERRKKICTMLLIRDVLEGELNRMRGRYPGAGLLIVQDSMRPSYKEGQRTSSPIC